MGSHHCRAMRLLVTMHGAIPSVCRNHLAAKLRAPRTLQVRTKATKHGSQKGGKGGKKGGNKIDWSTGSKAGGATDDRLHRGSRIAALLIGTYGGFAGVFRLCNGRWPGASGGDMEEMRNEIAAHVGAPLDDRMTMQGAVQLSGAHQERAAICPTQCKLLFQPDGTFTGAGSDSDGNFIVEDGLFNPQTNQIAWCEKGNVTTLIKGKLVSQGAGVSMEGVYESKTTDNSGTVQLRVNPLLQEEPVDRHAGPGAGNRRRPYSRILDCSHVERVLLIAYFPLVFGKKYFDQWRAGSGNVKWLLLQELRIEWRFDVNAITAD